MISLAMICRDNETTIREALESAKPWVDEMIVVDTGSIDSTKEIVKDVCGKVYSTRWQDDFSSARNTSLELCMNPWVYWMDSDEYLPPGTGKELRQLARDAKDDIGGISVIVREERQSFERVALIRNRPDIRFSGRVHEQISPAIYASGLKIHRTQITVEHRQDFTARPAKDQRNVELLSISVEENNTDAFSLFNLGNAYVCQEKFSDAIHYFLQSKDCSDIHECHMPKLYSMLAMCHIQLKYYDAARHVVDEGVDRYPQDPEVRFYWSLVRHACGDLDAAIQGYTDCRTMPQSVFLSDPQLPVKALHNIALIHEAKQNLSLALETWMTVINENRNYKPGWFELVRVAIAVGYSKGLVDCAKQAAG